MEADGARHAQLRTPVPIVEEAGLDPRAGLHGCGENFLLPPGFEPCSIQPPWRVAIPAATI